METVSELGNANQKNAPAVGSAGGVTVSDSIAYYVTDDASGLQIIDVSNVANPVRVGMDDTPDRVLGVAVSGSTAHVADEDLSLHPSLTCKK